jgi:hypothetical protein
MRSWPVSTILLLAALMSPAAARGQGASGDAERIKAAAGEFDEGRRAFKAKDYESAAGHFENADRDAPSPVALRSAIRARFEGKMLARAATLAASAMSRYPDDKATTRLAKQVLTSAQKDLYRLQVSCTPACTLLVDHKLATASENTEAVLFLEPGQHNVLASWSGDRSVGEQVISVAGEGRELTFSAPPERPRKPVAPPASAAPPPEPPPPPPPPSGLPKTVFFVGLGATVVLSGITLWSALDMRANPGLDRVRADCAGQSEDCPTYQEALSVQRRTNVLLGVTGGVAVITGVIGGFFIDWSSRPAVVGLGPLRAVTPSLAVGNGLAVGASGRF